MRIKSCTIYALRIPFVETFAHSARRRRFSDSIVVRVEAADGTIGYGEGAPRDYVTGETSQSSIEHIAEVLWPAVSVCDYEDLLPGTDPLEALAPVEASLPEGTGTGVVAFNAARASLEIALIDCLLRRGQISLAEILPPRRAEVTYSGVISSGSIESASGRARQFRLFGLGHLKVKIVGDGHDVARVRAVRETLGMDATLRVDANGAFDTASALEVAEELSPLRVEIFEQPLARQHVARRWREVRTRSSIPLMADESVVTLRDAHAFVESHACDYFNLRLSKCGGIAQTLRLARVAQTAGVRVGLGSQVGETAILSAAGRHLAAHLDDLAFAEGSYGKLLLVEDLSRDPLHFGHGGRAPLLRGPGLGLSVREDILERYAHHVIHLAGGLRESCLSF